MAYKFEEYSVGGNGGSVELDTTLTQAGKAADAKAVGDALANVSGGGSSGGGNNYDIEIYGVMIAGNGAPIKAPLETFIKMSYEADCNVDIEVVSAQPASIQISSITNGGTIYVKVVESTGVAYANVGMGVMTVGTIMFQNVGLDKGWAYIAGDEQGVYAVRTAKGYGSTKVITLVNASFNGGGTGNKPTSRDLKAIREDFANTVLICIFNTGRTVILRPAQCVEGTSGGVYMYSSAVPYLVEDQMSFVGARIATDGETITDEDGEIWFKSWEIGLTQ